MVRQMLGAVNEFVAANARERLAHGRAKALSEVALDPAGARSCKGNPKLGAPTALLEGDPQLMEKMKTYAAMPAKKRPTYTQIAKELKEQNKKWSVQKKGINKGKPWAAKQICMFLVRINSVKKVKKMPKLKAPSSGTSATKGKEATTKGQAGKRGGSQEERQKAKLRDPPGARSALQRKKTTIALPFSRSS